MVMPQGNMEEHVLSEISQIHALLERYPPSRSEHGWWYRGQADCAWPLVPKAGRPEFFLPVSLRKQPFDFTPLGGEHERFRRWKQQAVAYYRELPQTELECLAIAQHHGLATRLLDWTGNALVAVFFATWEHASVDGCIYCISPFKEPDLRIDVGSIGSLSVGRSVLAYVPPAISPRILNQAGAFTEHSPPNLDLLTATEKETKHKIEIVRFRIPANRKTDMQRSLNQLGVSRATLFPDLDGLSAQINAETSRLVAEKAAVKPA
jgi:hypothetical protein